MPASTRSASDVEDQANPPVWRPYDRARGEDRGYTPDKGKSLTPHRAELALLRIPLRGQEQTKQSLTEKAPRHQGGSNQHTSNYQHVIGRGRIVFLVGVVTH